MKKTLFLIAGLVISLATGLAMTWAQQTDANLEITSVTTEARVGDEFDVQVTLKNPGLQNVVSVRSWLDYNEKVIEAISINTEDSPFTLSAPGETEVSKDQGLVKLGRSNISGGYAQAEAKVATVRFKVITPYAIATVIEAYDYQISELGHTSVNIVEDAFPMNILSGEPEALIINLNVGAQPYSDADTGGPDVDLSPTDVTVTGFGFANLQRPQNLQINTGPGYVDLKWDYSSEPELVGYNIYYGKTSGMYTRRRTIGRVNQYRLDGLNNGEVYYFAVTAYDSQARESDYSDEVAIIISEPLSSTSPFDEITASLLARIPFQPQNGPLVGWLAFSALGLGGTLAFRKRRLNNSI
ncbi:fibronectin type III domain-containing protein [Candidatus Peregrinibacteria bacterium]|nr:fibronectin type III domain-containing protein [Candidatus Peregrinibacteria bacterium]